MEPLGHLVVVIPGIGGSVLEDPDGGAVYGQGRRQLAASVVWPERLSLAEHPQLRPVGLLPTLAVIPPLLVVPGYDGLIRQIENNFHRVRVDVSRPGREPDLGADLVLFPYDFRLGVADAAQRLAADVSARLAGLSAEARRRRVIVVAHSMGGLVARYWLGPLDGAPYCRALVTVGTPHRGAPKALDWLVNGARLGRLAHPRATEVMREWPGFYDLLPRYPAVWCAERGAAVYPYELDGVAPAGFLAGARRSFAVHGEIEKAFTELAQGAADQRPEVVALFARGHATLGRAIWADGKLRVVKDPDPDWLPNAGWRGDGTVPAISAIPTELDEERRSWRAVPERHGPMAATPAVVEILRTFAGASLSAVRGGDVPDHPWLGIDLDECVPAGEPVTVEARLYGAPAGPAVAWVRVKPLDSSGVRRQPCRMAETADGWRAVLDPLPEGRYEVAVEAVNVPGADRVRCVDVVAAV